MIVIEHNLDVIKTADWLIDIGPEGGDGGGKVIATGTPETIAGKSGSFTGTYLKILLSASQRARRTAQLKWLNDDCEKLHIIGGGMAGREAALAGQCRR